jgi:hypothetical protein
MIKFVSFFILKWVCSKTRVAWQPTAQTFLPYWHETVVPEPFKQPDVPTYAHGDSAKHFRKKVKSLTLLTNKSNGVNFGREHTVGTVMAI